MVHLQKNQLAALGLLIFLTSFVFFGARQLGHFRAQARENPYRALAQKLNDHGAREACDVQLAKQRLYCSAVLDRFGAEIRQIWRERAGVGEPNFSLLDLGAVKLRINPREKQRTGYDSSAWSWDEAYGLIQKIQKDLGSSENGDRWRDVDSMVRFLIEKDYSRLVLGKKFLSPRLTEHQFRPNPAVTRVGPAEFRVQLDPGDFRGYEKQLQRILEAEWQGVGGFQVKIEWVSIGGYRLQAHRDSSRSFVNHKRKTMEIANLAWTKTLAHELGHILGFDDHYYNVWNARNCYYLQESRLSDLMSNSEHGGVMPRHWEILEKAYSWRTGTISKPFSYTFGE